MVIRSPFTNQQNFICRQTRLVYLQKNGSTQGAIRDILTSSSYYLKPNVLLTYLCKILCYFRIVAQCGGKARVELKCRHNAFDIHGLIKRECVPAVPRYLSATFHNATHLFAQLTLRHILYLIYSRVTTSCWRKTTQTPHCA